MLEPAIVIDPGETLVVETVNHMTPIVRSEQDLREHGSPGYIEREETGPIYVRGAAPGDVLSIDIIDIQVVGIPHAHGSGPLVHKYSQRPIMFPMEGDRCVFPGGVRVKCSPLVGDIYTTPSCENDRTFDHGGNMDFPDIRAGNRLYLPVQREGALLVLGDVHAVQGFGELFGEGAETAADVEVTIGVNNRYKNLRPIVETDSELVFLGSRGTIYESLRRVVEDATLAVSRICGISDRDAYVLCTVVGSVKVGGCMTYNGLFTEDKIVLGLSVPKDALKVVSRGDGGR